MPQAPARDWDVPYTGDCWVTWQWPFRPCRSLCAADPEKVVFLCTTLPPTPARGPPSPTPTSGGSSPLGPQHHQSNRRPPAAVLEASGTAGHRGAPRGRYAQRRNTGRLGLLGQLVALESEVSWKSDV